MDISQAAILGLVQGLTEFLPVSSSGHLILVPKLLGWADQGLGFDAMIHLGTALAVIYHYRQDCRGVLRSLINPQATGDVKRLRNAILLGSVPALIAGVFLKNLIDAQARNVGVVAFNLIFWGLILILADWKGRQSQSTSAMQTPSLRTALWAGFAQAIALLPGTSRSGITISASIFSGLNRTSAVRFSFLLGLPVILGASLFSSFHLLSEVRAGSITLAPLLVALAASFLGGVAAIRLLLAVLSNVGLTAFALYRFALAAFILIYLR